MTTIVRRMASSAPRPMPADDLRRVAAVGAASAIIDVRTAEKYAAGHISGSINVPDSKITALVHALTLHPGAVLVCDNGHLSSMVARTVGFSGFTETYYLDGGLAAWVEVGGTTMETTERGTERRVGKPQRESNFVNVARQVSLRLLFVGFAASAAMVALALHFL